MAAHDNWEHRSSNMLCSTCMYYVPKSGGVIGRCRRNAPTIKGFPAVFPRDWCGEHKINENAISDPSAIHRAINTRMADK